MKFRNCKKFRYGIPAHFEPCLCFVPLTLISNNPFRILCPLSCPSQRDPYKSPNLSLRCGRGAKFKYRTAWVVTRRSVASFSSQRSDSSTGQCISDVWWTNWLGIRFIRVLWIFFCQYHSTPCSTFTDTSCGEIRPSSTETQSHSIATVPTAGYVLGRYIAGTCPWHLQGSWQHLTETLKER
jgi:hypothetical protein